MSYLLYPGLLVPPRICLHQLHPLQIHQPHLPLGHVLWSHQQYSFQALSLYVSTQICVGVGRSKDADGFIRVSSGKKRGLVPADSLAEI